MKNLPAKAFSILAIFLSVVIVGCGGTTTPTDPVDDVGYAFDQQLPLRERCTQKQQARLEACSSAEGEGTGECVAAAKALMEACSDLPDEVLMAGASENTGLCDGECDVVECTVANPCDLGKDVDGDGTNDSCVTGERCDTACEGDVCDEGILFDCYCTTFYYPKNIIRPLDECRCYCD